MRDRLPLQPCSTALLCLWIWMAMWQCSTAADGPDIREPGPDMGDFPNSAFTLPKGRVYVEMAPCTLVASDRFTPAAYAWPYLIRYGVTDDVEFRLMGNGLTTVFGSQDTTGFSPLILDLKVHLWDEKREWFLPASSLEVYLQTDWASPAFQGGMQPSLNMNFDLRITESTNLEWTLGYTGVQDAVDVVTGERFSPRHNFLIPGIHEVGLNVNQFSFQWAVEQDLSERLQAFVHGYYNGSIFLQQGAGSVVGAGFFWTCSERLIFFGSCNAGLDDNVAPVSGQWGFSLAL